MKRFWTFTGMRAAVVAALAALAAPGIATAQAEGDTQVDAMVTQTVRLGASGLPLPRFASLKSSKINMRIGPGREHRIAWTYVRAGLPVEIILEYDNWRKIRDADGTEGWVYHSMLSGRRTAVVEPWAAVRVDSVDSLLASAESEPATTVSLHASPDSTSRVVARIEPGVIAEIYECDGIWCAADVGSTKGWIEQSRLWGVYPDEQVDG